MGIEESLVQEIVQRILAVSQPERIILFGSAASDKMTPDSDIDLLILEASPQNPRRESVRLRAVLRGLGFPFDVIVMGRDRFEETKNVIGSIAYPAQRHGRVIHEVA